MTMYLPHKAQQVENRWLLPLPPSILATVSIIVTVASVSLAAAAECQVTEEGDMIQDMQMWKGSMSSILPLTITVERDIYGGLAPSSTREVAPYIKSNRIVLGNTENQDIARISPCLSKGNRKSARFNQAIITSIGKTQAKSHTRVMKVSALPYNGEKQVLKIRTTPQEIGISVRDKTPTLIGPVQETQKPILSYERSMSQAVAAPPSIVEFPSLFGSQPFVALNPFQNALQLPGNESFRMNLTTTQALHEGNCANGCP